MDVSSSKKIKGRPKGSRMTEEQKRIRDEKFLETHGYTIKEHFKMIGSKGGRNGHTGGFASNHELARIAGAIGGLNSTRKGIKNGEGKKCRKKLTQD